MKDLVDERGITYGVVQPGQPRPDGVPIVRVNNFTPTGLQLDDVIRIDPEIATRHTRSRLRGGEVLITLVGSTGQVAVAPHALVGWNVARAVGVVPVRGDVSPRWVAWCLQGPEAHRYLDARLNTTVQKTLNLRDLASLEIPIPPPEEREAITSVLGAVDDKIESNRRLAGLLEDTAATLFRARFVDFVGVDDFDESEIGQVPRGWRVMTLGDLATARKRTVRPLDSPDRLFEHFGIPAFDDGRRPERVTGATLLSGKTLLPDGDCVLLSKLNPATRRVWWPRPNGSDPAVSSPEFLVLVPRDALPMTYLYAVVAHDERFYSELLAHVSGTTGSRQRVKPGSALSCRVLHPSDAALQEWDCAAAPLYDQAAALGRESATLASVRDALLPKLISGQIRVPDANDPTEVIEPAAEALQAATQ